MANHNIVLDEDTRQYKLNGQDISAGVLEQSIRQAYHSGQSMEMHYHSVYDDDYMTTDPKTIYNTVLFDALKNLNRQSEYGDRLTQIEQTGIPEPDDYSGRPQQAASTRIPQPPNFTRDTLAQIRELETQFPEGLPENANNDTQQRYDTSDSDNEYDASRSEAPAIPPADQIPGSNSFPPQGRIFIDGTQVNGVPQVNSPPGTPMLAGQANSPGDSPPPTPRGSAGSPPPSLHGSAGETPRSSWDGFQDLPGWFAEDNPNALVPEPSADAVYDFGNGRLPIPHDDDFDEPFVVRADGSESPPITPRGSESPPQSPQGTQYSNFARVVSESPPITPQGSSASSNASSEFTDVMEQASHTPGPFTRRAAREASLQSSDNSSPANLSSSDSEPAVVGKQGQVQNPVVFRHTLAGTAPEPAADQSAQPTGRPPRAPR